MRWVPLVFIFHRSMVRCQAELANENLLLGQQLAILKEKTKRPRLRPRRPGTRSSRAQRRGVLSGLRAQVLDSRGPNRCVQLRPGRSTAAPT